MRRALLLAALALPLPALAQDQAAEDRDWLTAFLEDNLSSAGRQVVITGFQGALSSEASIAQLTIADGQGVWLTVNGVVLDWNRSALFGGQVQVQRLTAEEIILERLPVTDPEAPAAEARPFALPELPVAVEIAELGAARIALGAGVLGEAVEGRLTAGLSLNGAGEGDGRFLLERTDGRLSRIALEAAFANATQDLTLDLTAEEGPGGLAAQALNLPGEPAVALTVAGSGPLTDFRADLSLRTDDVERLAGAVVIGGEDGGARSFSVDLAGNPAPLFLPEYADFLGDRLTLVARGTRSADGALNLPELELRARTLSLAGTIRTGADGQPQRVALLGQVEDPEGAPVLLPLAGTTETRIDRAGLAVLFDAAVGEDWAGKFSVDGLVREDIRIDRLELGGKSRLIEGSAGATLTYLAAGLSPTDPALARALGDEIGGVVVADWNDAAGELRLPTITSEGAGLVLNGSATLGNLPQGIDLTASARLRADDLSRFAPISGMDLSGSGQIDLRRLQTNLASGAFDIDLTVDGQALGIGIAEVDRLLAGRSVVSLQAARDETGTMLRAFDVRAGPLRATGSGTIASAGSDLTVRADLTDLGALGPRYGGRLQAEARLTGTPEDAQITLTGTGTDLRTGVAEADRLLTGTSSLTAAARVADGAVDLADLRVTAQNLVAQAAGRIAPDTTMLAADVQLPDLSVLGGAYGGGLTARASFAGTAEAGQITLDGTGTDLRIGDAQADRLLAGTSTVSAALRTEGGLIRLDNAELRNPQLSATASGTVDGAVRRLTLDARLADLALIVPGFSGALTVAGQAVQGPEGYTLDLAGQGPGGIDATVRGTLAPNLSRANLTIAGRAQAELANIFLDPTSVQGATTFDLRLNGPLALASLAGRVSLSGGRIAGPGLPFTLSGIDATADLTGGRAAISARAGISTGGTLTLSGNLGLGAPFEADLTADLQGFVLRDPDLYQTRGNGTISLRGPLTGGAAIGGRLALIESEVRVPDTGFGATGALPGLEHIGELAAVRQTRQRAGLTETGGGSGGGGAARPFVLDLEIIHPNRLFIRGRGLDAELGGTLRLGGTTAAIIPDGAFELIRGRLDILGKRLTLSEAELRLEGDFTPSVRIVASNTTDGVVSSVQVLGRINAPEVSFTSVPDLPQEEVLSRLLFGRGLDTLSAFQAAQLASAVATLAGRGGEGILSRLRRGFGLDDLDLATGDDGTTSLTAGKYLSRNLYTEIEVGQDGQSDISLNLDVTDNLTVRGRVGSEGGTGIGLFYERDY